MGHSKEEKMALRDKGMTYQQIADHLGISYQAVAQTLTKYSPSHFRIVKPSGCAYTNIRNWMNANKVGMSEFVRRCGLGNSYSNKNRMTGYLKGKSDPPKRTIDKILSVTGLTYEEAFGTMD